MKKCIAARPWKSQAKKKRTKREHDPLKKIIVDMGTPVTKDWKKKLPNPFIRAV